VAFSFFSSKPGCFILSVKFADFFATASKIGSIFTKWPRPPFPANDMQQHECRAGRPLGPTLQLQHLACCQIQAPGENGLSQMGSFAHRANFIAADRVRDNIGITCEMGERDFFMRRRIQNADAPHVVGGFQQRLGQVALTYRREVRPGAPLRNHRRGRGLLPSISSVAWATLPELILPVRLMNLKSHQANPQGLSACASVEAPPPPRLDR
jgi:hypothetical protein